MLILLLKLFFFLRESSFRILDIQISWQCQVPKHKTRKTCYWISWEVNTVCKWNLASLCHITKDKTLSKNSTKTVVWKLVLVLLSLQRIRYNFYWKTKFLKQATYIRYLIAKLSKFVQTSFQTSSNSFLQRILWKLKRAWN